MFWTIQYKHSLSFLKRWTPWRFHIWWLLKYTSPAPWVPHWHPIRSNEDGKVSQIWRQITPKVSPPLPNSGARMDVTSPLLSHLFAYVNMKTAVSNKIALFCYTLTGRITIPTPIKEVSGIMEGCVERKYFCVSFVRHSSNGEDRADRLSTPPWWWD